MGIIDGERRPHKQASGVPLRAIAGYALSTLSKNHVSHGRKPVVEWRRNRLEPHRGTTLTTTRTVCILHFLAAAAGASQRRRERPSPRPRAAPRLNLANGRASGVAGVRPGSRALSPTAHKASVSSTADAVPGALAAEWTVTAARHAPTALPRPATMHFASCPFPLPVYLIAGAVSFACCAPSS